MKHKWMDDEREFIRRMRARGIKWEGIVGKLKAPGEYEDLSWAGDDSLNYEKVRGQWKNRIRDRADQPFVGSANPGLDALNRVSDEVHVSEEHVDFSWNTDEKSTAEPEAKKDAEVIDYRSFSKELFTEAERKASLIKAPAKEDVFHGPIEEDAVLLLSDMHIGKVNSFLDLATNESYETYNREIMIKEVNALLDGICTINTLLASAYKIRKLYIFGLGDLMDNDRITKGQKFFIDMGVGEQLIVALGVFSKLILELLRFYDEIDFTVVPGNHGRTTERRSREPVSNNYDWQLGAILRREFANEPRVTITPANDWFYLKDIYGWKYYLHHGESVYSWMSMPYYGITRRGKERRTELPIDIEAIGHFHHPMKIHVNSYSQTIINGCWVDKDGYSWKQHATLSKAVQLYFGVSPKRPMTWDWNIELTKDDGNIRRQWADWARLRTV